MRNAELGAVSNAVFIAASSSAGRRLMSMSFSFGPSVCKNQIARPRASIELSMLCRPAIWPHVFGLWSSPIGSVDFGTFGFTGAPTAFAAHTFDPVDPVDPWPTFVCTSVVSGGVSSNSRMMRLLPDLRRGDSLNMSCSSGRETLPMTHWQSWELACQKQRLKKAHWYLVPKLGKCFFENITKKNDPQKLGR